MNIIREQDRQAWHRLIFLLDRVERHGPQALDGQQLWELGRLYRRVTADLARARTEGADDHVIAFLNDLAVRAHGEIYRTRAVGRGRIWPFLSAQFPRRVRETLPYSAAALLVCVLAGVAGFAAVMADPETASAFIPETLRRHVESRMSSGEMDGPSLPLDLSPLLSSAILFNNVRVAVLSFGLGITAGLGTVCVLIQNGLLLGALAGIAARHEASAAFWALILPHGVIEMAAIFIAAGSGLKIAHALIAPGDLTRRDALVRAAREVTPLLLGAVSMLAVAALVEGFLTPAPVPDSVKLAFGGATLCLLVAYFALAGRGRHRDGRHDPARLESGLRGKQV